MKRTLIFIILLISGVFLMAKALEVHVDENRFLTEDGLTNLEINYAVPYYALDFIKLKVGYQAELFVDISIKYGDQLIKNESFTNGIIIKQGEKIFSDETYLDKISIALKPYLLNIEVVFTDVHNENLFTWAYEFVPLANDVIASDMEFSSLVEADTTSYLDKFHRDEYLYFVQPSRSFFIDQEMVYFYQELYNLFEDENGNFQASLDINVKKGSELIDTLNLKFIDKWQNINKLNGTLAIGKYEEGYYELEITVIDLVTGLTESKTEGFFLKAKKTGLHRLFPELEDDFILGTYFFNTNQKKIWKTLSTDGKKNFLSKFWQSNDPNPTTPENEFMDELKKRINYANTYYSHFKEGWTSDMGKIYIKYGQPYEISKHKTNSRENEFMSDSSTEEDDQTSIRTYKGNTYGVKDYQIWKYRLGRNATYIFIDTMTSGEFKLIYSSDDDDGETSLHNWRDYLGDDFEDGLLN